MYPKAVKGTGILNYPVPTAVNSMSAMVVYPRSISLLAYQVAVYTRFISLLGYPAVVYTDSKMGLVYPGVVHTRSILLLV